MKSIAYAHCASELGWYVIDFRFEKKMGASTRKSPVMRDCTYLDGFSWPQIQMMPSCYRRSSYSLSLGFSPKLNLATKTTPSQLFKITK